MENTNLRRVSSNICWRIFQADVGQDHREKSFFFPEFWKVKKKNYHIMSVGDHSGKVWLGSSGISNFWPSIVTGLTLP